MKNWKEWIRSVTVFTYSESQLPVKTFTEYVVFYVFVLLEKDMCIRNLKKKQNYVVHNLELFYKANIINTK